MKASSRMAPASTAAKLTQAVRVAPAVRGVAWRRRGCEPENRLERARQREPLSRPLQPEEGEMAAATRDKDLFKLMRATGVRKKVAVRVSEAVAEGNRAGKKAPKTARRAVRDFGELVSQLEDRVNGGPAKRSAAAKKAARTRKREAAKRSDAARRAAKARARS